MRRREPPPEALSDEMPARLLHYHVADWFPADEPIVPESYEHADTPEDRFLYRWARGRSRWKQARVEWQAQHTDPAASSDAAVKKQRK